MVEKVINIDPEIMGGTPVFQGTRVPINYLFEYLRMGESLESFFEGYPSVQPILVERLLKMSETLMISIAQLENEPHSLAA